MAETVGRLPALGTRLLLLWIAGNALRVTILTVPPVLPAIHRSLHLDEKMVGALSGLPVLLLALGAVWGSLLVARVGARRALLIGLTLVAVAGAARGFGPATPVLFAATFLMGVGIAVSQPTLPSLVRQWVPEHMGTATALYANGLLVGEILAASLTTPLVLPLVGHRWEYALLMWSVPVALTALAIAAFTEHDPPHGPVRIAWWPDWRNRLTWRLGLVLGCASAAYFGSNAFIPDYLRSTHSGQYIPAALTSLNLLQLPASILAAVYPARVIGRRWPLLVAGLGTLVAAAGFGMGGFWVVGWAGILGFCTATVLILILALPPLLAGTHDVHRLTAAIFTITYLCSFVGSLVGGTIWDITRVPITSFTPVAFAGIVMMALVFGLELSSARQRL